MGSGQPRAVGHAVPHRLSRLCPCAPVPPAAGAGRQCRAEHPPPPPRCLPPPAGSGTPALPAAAPGCRSSGACGLSAPRQHGPLPARSAAPFFAFTQLWVKCGVLLPQFPAAPCVALSSLLQHHLERRGLAFPLLCSEAQSSVLAPTDLAARCPTWTLCAVPWALSRAPFGTCSSVLCGRATVLISPDSLLVYSVLLTS